MIHFTQEDFKRLIASPNRVNVILDTDAYNEVDDQFCLSYLMRSKERINLLSVNAAPFLNERSSSAEDGMEKSYREIFKVRKLADPTATFPVYRGSRRFLSDKQTPEESEAADNIVKTVKEAKEPVILIAIGAITNVASALLKCPELSSACGLIWLGGTALQCPSAREFNLAEDIAAAQVVFESGIPFVQVPCEGVCTEFVTTMPELEYYLRGKNALCDYLIDNVKECAKGRYAYSRIIWDVTAAAILLCGKGYRYVEIPRPIVTNDCHYAFDLSNKPYLYVQKLYRDRIYGSLFRTLSEETEHA